MKILQLLSKTSQPQPQSLRSHICSHKKYSSWIIKIYFYESATAKKPFNQLILLLCLCCLCCLCTVSARASIRMAINISSYRYNSSRLLNVTFADIHGYHKNQLIFQKKTWAGFSLVLIVINILQIYFWILFWIVVGLVFRAQNKYHPCTN